MLILISMGKSTSIKKAVKVYTLTAFRYQLDAYLTT